MILVLKKHKDMISLSPGVLKERDPGFISHCQKLNKTNVRTLGSTDLGRETNKNVQDTYIKKTSKSSFQTIMI